MPAEACVVEPGYVRISLKLHHKRNSNTQAYNSRLAKLNPDQTEKMRDFAVRKPHLNADSILSSGLSVLGLSQRESDVVRNLTLSIPHCTDSGRADLALA